MRQTCLDYKRILKIQIIDENFSSFPNYIESPKWKTKTISLDGEISITNLSTLESLMTQLIANLSRNSYTRWCFEVQTRMNIGMRIVVGLESEKKNFITIVVIRFSRHRLTKSPWISSITYIYWLFFLRLSTKNEQN